MTMFIQIIDRVTNNILSVDITTIKSYSIQNQKDKENNIHYLIVYSLPHNAYIEEEFTSDTERQTKLDELSLFGA